MSLLITGIERRNMKDQDYRLVCDAITASGFIPHLVITGKCNGIEKAAVKWCKKNRVSMKKYRPDIDSMCRYDVRNVKLVKQSSVAIIIWDGVNPEHADIIKRCQDAGIPTHIVVI